jgi:transcriptional regulator with XRE-family HTH domain
MTRRTLDQSEKNRLRLVREELRFSQAEFSEATGIPAHKVKYAESPKAKISTDIAQVVADKFGYSVEWILTGKGPTKKEGQEEYEGRPLSEPEIGGYRVTRVIHPAGISPVEQKVLQRAIELVETAAAGATPEAKAEAIMAILAALEVVKKKEG